MRIAVVGPCASGKTALVERLRKLGYEAHECVQEHSYVPTMWQKISRPDVLIYLDASPEERARRRHLETLGRGEPSDYQQVLADLRRRDRIDSTREAAPLRAADDAVRIDSTEMTIDQVVHRAEALARAAIG